MSRQVQREKGTGKQVVEFVNREFNWYPDYDMKGVGG